MHTPPLLLIVDDSRTSRTLIRSMVLQFQPDWRTVEAECGEDALALVAQETPDFVTMDVNMPGMSGLEAAGRIRIKYPEVRIVLFTANIQEAVRQAAERAGVHFVSKPVTPKSVALALEHFKS
jgi:CheY-like chemotaxis protein